jgi:serralysin
MATEAQIAVLKQLYTGVFGHLPTRSALNWYAGQIDRLKLDTAALADVLLYDDTQPGASHAFNHASGDQNFVKQVYMSLFGWSASALNEAVHVEGVRYWSNILQNTFSGSKGKLIETMLWVVDTNGATSSDASTKNAYHLLENREAIATYYAVDRAGESGNIDFLRNVVKTVTGQKRSVDAAKSMIDAAEDAGSAVNRNVVSQEAGDGLLGIREGDITSRWNFPDAVGSLKSAPAGIGEAVDISYSFLTSPPTYSSLLRFSRFSALQENATKQVLSLIEEVANIDFRQDYANRGQITYANSPQSEDRVGFAYLPSYEYTYSGQEIKSVTEIRQGGDVWINSNQEWKSWHWETGKQGFNTLMHETGHALGLTHPFEPASNGYLVGAAMDNELYTVMSYTSAPRSTILEMDGDTLWMLLLAPSTLMMLDIEALQYLYGANLSTRAGDNVYAWETNPVILETLWDSGGNDTIDCSNQKLTCIINLQAGSFSSISLRQTDAELRSSFNLPAWYANEPLPDDIYNGSNNIAIARGVIIENAIGGSGNDQIHGNAANNRLTGNKGNDVLQGEGGNDTYHFSRGDGQDVILDTSGQGDVIEFGPGILPSDLRLARSGQDLALILENTYDQMTITSHYNNSCAIEALYFADGGILDLQTIGATLQPGMSVSL